MSKRRSMAGTPSKRHSENKYNDIVSGVYELKDAGRYVVELFTEVPNASLYPDYREIVTMPISMAEVSKRARLNAYDLDEDFLGDFEQMLENAKLYNGEDSPVVEDATIILDYVLGRLGRPISEATRQKQQLKVLQELMAYKYKGRRLSEVFMVEPDPKEYPSYYEVVKDATSFTTVENQLKELACDDWKAFIDLVDPIFKNAMLFNQEGSQIYSDAKSLQRQLRNKVNKYLPAEDMPPPSVKLKIRRTMAESDSSGDEDSDEESEEEEVVEHRFDDDDDDDFEADPDDYDEEDVAGEEGEEEDEDDMALPIRRDASSVPGMINPLGQPMVPMKQTIVRDEIFRRPDGKTAKDGLIQLVTCTSQSISSYLQSQHHLGLGQNQQANIQVPPPFVTNLIQVRVPAPKSRVMMAFSTTLPSYQNNLVLTVYLHEQLRSLPYALTVLLNGRKLAAVNPHVVRNVPLLREEFELRLSPGLNQVTVAAIKGDDAGNVRPFGPAPIVGSANDEERMVFWLNLTR